VAVGLGLPCGEEEDADEQVVVSDMEFNGTGFPR
jgi:hypothetical protein